MADTIRPTPPVPPDDSPAPDTLALLEQLQTLSQQLRESGNLGPRARVELAGLVDELAEALDPAVTPALAQHLAETTAHLGQVLAGPEPDAEATGPLGAAVTRLEAAASHAEAHAPVATGLVRRLIDAIAALGA